VTPESTFGIYTKISSAPLALALVLSPETDADVLPFAIERAFQLGGPRWLFSQIACAWIEDPKLAASPQHDRLDKRMHEVHVQIDALWIDENDVDETTAHKIIEELSTRLRSGGEWNAVLAEYQEKYRVDANSPMTRIGNLGDFVVSPSKRDALPFRRVSIPAAHVSKLLAAKKTDVVAIDGSAADLSAPKDPKKRAWFLYRVSDRFDPKELPTKKCGDEWS